MKYLYVIVTFFIVSSTNIQAQNFTISLWQDSIPNYKNTNETEHVDSSDIILIKNIQNPDIAIFLPSQRNATGEAVVICPGGGYYVLAYNWEGTDIARSLNAKGIAAIVLKYRLPTSGNSIIQYKSPLLDAQRAMRIVRFNAKKWNIDKNKIGIMGFSAGGHLASTLSTHFDNGDTQNTDSIEQMSCRPDFSALIYSVISFNDSITHPGSKEALLGKNPPQKLVNYFSNELQVTANTPPAFLIHASNDNAVPVKNSLVYYEALVKYNISAEMHIYPYGEHGFSLAIESGHLAGWIDLCTDWIHYITTADTNK